MLTRRHFLQTAAVAAAAAADRPKRLAILAADYRPLSPARMIADRFRIGYPYAGAWRKPDLQVVSLHITAKPEGDPGATVYPTVAEALRCGGPKLAVDAVILDGDFSEPCVQAFEQEGRAVPVFQCQRYPGSFEKAAGFVAASRRLRFPLMAGSSLPVTWRLPAIDLSPGGPIEEALVVGAPLPNATEFDALEALQCMVERRRGGETGIKAVQFLEGDAVWQALDAGRCSKDLLSAALSRSDTPLGLTVDDGRTQDLVASGQLRVLAKAPAGYFLEYRDGLKAAVLMLDGAIKDFNFAARLTGPSQIHSTQFLLTPDPQATHSACLVRKVEEMIETGLAPWPVDRTLLTSGILEAAVASKAQNHARVETPHLKVAYKPPQQSQFAQA